MAALQAHRLHLHADPLRHRPGPRRVRPDQDQHELLAAVAGGQVDAPAAGLRDAGDARQGDVARLVPERVVEALELVAVHEQQAHLVVVAPGALELLVQTFVQIAVVVEAGGERDR